jgi:hypothetical protein
MTRDRFAARIAHRVGSYGVIRTQTFIDAALVTPP